jgi:serine protease inhibitor
VAKVRTPESAAPELELTTVEFTLTGEHDLLHDPAIFGLEAASDTSSSHFPGISATPLAVDSAEQSVTATFSAEGFRAAAVTAMGIMFMGAHAGDLPYEQTSVKAFFDRPFGFLAVHRETRLVLAAGWVTDPKPYREDDYN